MSTALIDLARRAVACRRWRWRARMGVYPVLSDDTVESVIGTVVAVGELVHVHWPDVGMRSHCTRWHLLPDLTDPATLGCMLDIVREIHGRSTVIRLVGTDGQGGEEWAICDRAPGGMAASSIYGFTSELEALVAALEAAP